MYKVAFICQPEYFRFCYEDALNDFFDVYEVPYNFDMNYNDLSCLENIDADFNIFFRGEFIPDELLSRLKGIKINLSSEPFPRHIDGKLNYSFDSIKRYFTFRDIKYKKYDYVFHYDEASLPFLKKDGLLLSGSFAFPVATNIYSQKIVEKQWDLFFIGRSSTYREKYFTYLKHRYNFLHIAHGIWGPELAQYVCKAKICLNIHAENEISWEPRLQMLLATGAFVISEKVTPNSILRPNIDFVEVESPQELHESVAYYLTHPSERQAIAESGCRRVREKLDARVEFSRLLREIESGQVAKFTVGQERKLFNILQKIMKTTRHVKNLLK